LSDSRQKPLATSSIRRDNLANQLIKNTSPGARMMFGIFSDAAQVTLSDPARHGSKTPANS
jgi:hypothetical protein